MKEDNESTAKDQAESGSGSAEAASPGAARLKLRVWGDGRMHYDASVTFEDGQVRAFPFVGIESGESIYEDAMRNPVIMQFTGLKDKNGREIYEGDRVFVVIEQTIGEDFSGEAEVEWSDTFGAWVLDFPSLGQSVGFHAAEEIEVLGNIYEGLK